MKMHIRNLVIAIGTYLAAFFGITFFSMVSGIIYLDGQNSDDETIYILSILATALVSLASYLIFYFKERKNADRQIYIEYLGLGTRIVWGVIASVTAITVFLLCCYFWISDYGDTISILRLYINTTVVFLGLFTGINFVDFIVLKPRP